MIRGAEDRMKDLAHQRNHGELVDMLASFIEEFRKYSRLMASEAPQIAEPLVQVSWAQSYYVGSASAPGPARFKSADSDSEYLKFPVLSRIVTDCPAHRSLGGGLQGQRAGHHRRKPLGLLSWEMDRQRRSRT